VPAGVLQPGTYVAHPLPKPHESLTVTFTVPAGWQLWGDSGGLGASLIPAADGGTQAPDGMAIQFIDVTSLNGDVCHWAATDDDVAVGPAVDDLVEALETQSAFEVTYPIDITIGGYSGKRVNIIGPTKPFSGQTAHAPGCDETVLRLWSNTVAGPYGIYLQGPANRWQANIVDVDGTRLVIVVQDFPGTSPADRAELARIVQSLVIEP
jgi:hypothetical protein